MTESPFTSSQMKEDIERGYVITFLSISFLNKNRDLVLKTFCK